MIITIQFSDIIKRCLWNEYKRFCLIDKTQDEIIKLIQEDKPFIISEEDAYVIGLLKVIETDNLVHRFKIHIDDLLKVRSNLFNSKLYINKNVILNETTDFRNRFPESFKPNFHYQLSIDSLYKFIDTTLEKLRELNIHTKILNDKTYIFVLSNDVKKIINS